MINPEEFVKKTIEDIKKNIKEKAIIACSGGVDSTTSAVIAKKALGDKLICVFIDTGFLREGERESVENLLKKYGLNPIVIDASERFISELSKAEDAEEKRKIFARIYWEVLEEVAKEKNVSWLISGTIAPDWIETEGGIKSHHNITLPKGLKLKIYEPLRDLYKDEVRQVARYLGLKEIVEKMPFPGPGLAIRIVGKIDKKKIEIVRKANKIVEEEVEKANLKVWQAFAVLLPVRTVGVVGDERAYGYTIAVRIVESRDAMTANFARVDWELLARIANRITSEIPEVNRVLYDITNKPPACIEYE